MRNQYRAQFSSLLNARLRSSQVVDLETKTFRGCLPTMWSMRGLRLAVEKELVEPAQFFSARLLACAVTFLPQNARF
jgi:hypothetical protein